MSRFKALPLGIDIGTVRARIAFAESDDEALVRVRAVVSRDLPDEVLSQGAEHSAELVAATLEDMVAELDTRERRCVLGIGAPAAALRVLRFPPMSSAERSRAARFEAGRIASWNVDAEESIVRVHPFEKAQNLYAVGVVRAAALRSPVAVAKSAGMRVIAVDHESLAFRRAFPQCDAVLDIGRDRSALHCYSAIGPTSSTISFGGEHVTEGIALDLAIDAATAEKRKRILGSAGAGASSRAEIVMAIAQSIERARIRAPITRIAVTGNGARLPGLLAELEPAASVTTTMPVTDMLLSDAYPQDVIRSAAPDWTLAVALASWGTAA